ncbi:DMT family transporter [Pseudomonas sp. GX19020]|uniref:DMT family transporter n=1 Tax=Pseudomonas sp. GX19020 TaxID=2942277 RepID=UPI0020199592|nr:DMT family transporter [Pseudomonas sp. GX19020]MCL4066772.1 DMT family transporter [Pseudomonas sp. GX19020]
MQTAQNPARGILLMILAILAFTLLDASAKGLLQRYPAPQVIWARFLGQVLIVVLILRGRTLIMWRTSYPGLHVLRAFFQVSTAALFFTSLNYIGLAEATALTDTSPVLVTLGAALFLGERLGPKRILAICVALVGAVITVRPGGGVFTWWALMPLAAAVSFAANSLLTRRIGQYEPVWTAMLWGGLFGTLAFTVFLPTNWVPVAAADLPLFVFVGCIGTLGQVLMIRSLSIAEAGTVAPFTYIGVVFATLWGALFFSEYPDFWTVTGALVIVGAGLYVWHRETRLLRR